ncbi:Acid stress protein IbaG [Candidatus Ecksteinia adelgidicola]|nr:Acid stress protein IbaG [Candidatus Ecksteinia adelgidicola]
MNNNEIKNILMKTLPLDEVYVTGDGSHFKIIVVGDFFCSMSRIKKQQAVYKPLIKYIENNNIHALSIKAYTSKEWKLDKKLNKV